MTIEKPFTEHVQDLRKAFIRSLLIFIMASLMSYGFSEQIFTFLLRPLAVLFNHAADPHRFIYTHLTEAFMTYIKVAAFSGFIIAFPFIAVELWRFMSPGLYEKEQRVFKLLLVFVPIFFLAGATFAYTFVLPRAFSFFLSFETSILMVPLQLEAKISEYLSLIMRMIIAFGISFQLPLVLCVLSYLGIITAKTLQSSWRYAILGITILSAIITPPDALSMIMLAIPLLLLYTLTIVVVQKIEKRKKHA